MLTETQVRTLLGIPSDNRVQLEIDWDGSAFIETECYEGDCRHGDPTTASVHIDWTKPGFDEDTDAPTSLKLQELAFCMEHARAEIETALEETAPFAHDPEVSIKVVVNGWYLRYVPTGQAVAA